MNEAAAHVRRNALREASEWLLRLQDEALSDAELEEWGRWMAASPHHAAAFDDLDALWEAAAALDSAVLERARAAAARVGLEASKQPAAAAPAPIVASAWRGTPPPPAAGAGFGRRHRTMRRLAAGAAAGLALAAGAWFFAWREPPADRTQVVATAVGERRQLTLADGSTLELDAASEIVVRYAERRRDVELRKGQAYFSVAHAPERPFTVTAAGVRSRALGTRFAVGRRGDRVAVTVAEGRVRVTAPQAGRSEPVRHELAPDQQLDYSPATGFGTPHPVHADQALAWREGALVYQGEPLANVIEDLNRYSHAPIRLQDPALGGLKVTGRCELSELDRWLEGVAAALRLRVQRSEAGILLSRSDGRNNAVAVRPGVEGAASD